ncbi:MULTISPECIES: hypothetical protein [Iodidimonas]|jgi:hypothetical protein|uniref:Uncharacterized protein n=1 Tax=Iodidimonas nitroreducens TaxID=1236968 RepID=A0A5A7NAC8_9PROT|nr:MULTISPECIES: hypothetical protein [Iodidimonas]GAK32636.1 hypothetical protein AQ1_00503 [alpha proteobacterium Q-1]GER05333.1 hypothetical protein JCM17846_30150 [Iodidimonas nitroreducens]
MDGQWLFLAEMILTFVLVLGFGFRELWLLRKDRLAKEKPPETGPENPQETSSPPLPARHSKGQHGPHDG